MSVLYRAGCSCLVREQQRARITSADYEAARRSSGGAHSQRTRQAAARLIHNVSLKEADTGSPHPVSTGGADSVPGPPFVRSFRRNGRERTDAPARTGRIYGGRICVEPTVHPDRATMLAGRVADAKSSCPPTVSIASGEFRSSHRNDSRGANAVRSARVGHLPRLRVDRGTTKHGGRRRAGRGPGSAGRRP
jgi:hypothetical protein